MSEPETVTPPAKPNDSLSACDDGGRIPTECGLFEGEHVSVLRPNNTATERCIPTGCLSRHDAYCLRNDIIGRRSSGLVTPRWGCLFFCALATPSLRDATSATTLRRRRHRLWLGRSTGHLREFCAFHFKTGTGGNRGLSRRDTALLLSRRDKMLVERTSPSILLLTDVIEKQVVVHPQTKNRRL